LCDWLICTLNSERSIE